MESGSADGGKVSVGRKSVNRRESGMLMAVWRRLWGVVLRYWIEVACKSGRLIAGRWDQWG